MGEVQEKDIKYQIGLNIQDQLLFLHAGAAELYMQVAAHQSE